MRCICKKCKFSTLLFIEETYQSQLLRIVLRCLILRKLTYTVREYIFRQSTFPFYNFVLYILLCTNNEICSYLIYAEQLRKLIVSTVKYVVRTCFVRYFTHCFGIVSRCSSYMKEGRNLCFYIVQGMYLDAAFLLSELCPLENFQTKVYRGWIESIYIAFKFEDVNAVLLSHLAYKIESIFLEYAVVSILICSCKGWFRYILTHAQVVTFGVMSFERNNQIAQAFSVGELSEHHCKELIPTSQVFDVTVSIIFCNNTVKFTSIEECD